MVYAIVKCLALDLVAGDGTISLVRQQEQPCWTLLYDLNWPRYDDDDLDMALEDDLASV